MNIYDVTSLNETIGINERYFLKANSLDEAHGLSKKYTCFCGSFKNIKASIIEPKEVEKFKKVYIHFATGYVSKYSVNKQDIVDILSNGKVDFLDETYDIEYIDVEW